MNKKLSQNNKVDEKFFRSLKIFQKKLKAFFEFHDIELPVIIFLKSRQEIDSYWNKKTESWLSAWAKDDVIYILDPKVYTRESSHKNIKHFWKTLRHEYVHLYYRKIAGTNRPKWLNEGLACYLAGQTKKKPASDHLIEVLNYYDKIDKHIYALGYYWTKLLIKKYGGKRMLLLIRSLYKDITEKQFAREFEKIYQAPYSREGFMTLIKKVKM